MDDTITVHWKTGKRKTIAILPRKEFKQFVEENCELCKLARHIKKERFDD